MLARLSQIEQLNQLAGYLYLPYQLLQLAGYRLAGQRCAYRWRQYGLTPLGTPTKRQLLIAGLFPTVVFCVLFGLQVILSIDLFGRYYPTHSPWIALFLLLQPLPFSLYAYLMIFDGLRLRRQLKQASQPAGPAQKDE